MNLSSVMEEGQLWSDNDNRSILPDATLDYADVEAMIGNGSLVNFTRGKEHFREIIRKHFNHITYIATILYFQCHGFLVTYSALSVSDTNYSSRTPPDILASFNLEG